jgi:KaiC/GvpD/RAD55 family RecA-like ATPase
MDEENPPIERIKTGITGLDHMLFGGMPKNSQILIAGGPGTGKTLLSLEILYNNAKLGIPCAFVTVEEKPETVVNNFKSAFAAFKDIDELIKSNTLIVTGETSTMKFQETSDLQAYTSFGNIVAEIEKLAETYKIKCIVID